MRWTELIAEQGRELDYKVEVAVKVIEEAFTVASRPALAFSVGGERGEM